jgi:hypothetical protein
MIDSSELLPPIDLEAEPNVPSVNGTGANAGSGSSISLSLTDLLPDSTGAIVVEGEGDDLRVRIVTDEVVVDAGVVAQLVTASGEDVSGHAYFAFENGTTLYAPRELDLMIVNIDV